MPVGQPACDHITLHQIHTLTDYALGADCPTEPPMEGSVRLRGGFGTPCDPVHSGFVEVFHEQEWGALCFGADYGDARVADVVCRQLGLPHGTVVDPKTNPPPGQLGSRRAADTEEATEPQERFWLTSVECRGPEDELLECGLGDGFSTDNAGCNPSRSIRFTVACRSFAVTEALENVTTPGAVEGELRLVNQTTVANWRMGRLEVFFEGSWSQVCGVQFDGADAEVACRQLGLAGGTVLPAPRNQPVSSLPQGKRVPYA
eukprot:jgi/Ulvmu1/6019/UM260_0003.1